MQVFSKAENYHVTKCLLRAVAHIASRSFIEGWCPSAGLSIDLGKWLRVIQKE
jgi:hypothetical protein